MEWYDMEWDDIKLLFNRATTETQNASRSNKEYMHVHAYINIHMHTTDVNVYGYTLVSYAQTNMYAYTNI